MPSAREWFVNRSQFLPLRRPPKTVFRPIKRYKLGDEHLTGEVNQSKQTPPNAMYSLPYLVGRGIWIHNAIFKCFGFTELYFICALNGDIIFHKLDGYQTAASWRLSHYSVGLKWRSKNLFTCAKPFSICQHTAKCTLFFVFVTRWAYSHASMM